MLNEMYNVSLESFFYNNKFKNVCVLCEGRDTCAPPAGAAAAAALLVHVCRYLRNKTSFDLFLFWNITKATRTVSDKSYITQHVQRNN